MPIGVYVRSEIQKEKLRIARLGKLASDETKKKMGDSHRGSKAYNWKGENVSYIGLHLWVYRNLGKATYCFFNKIHKAKRFHWANKSHQYKRDLNDWIPLCPRCHYYYDDSGKKRYASHVYQASLPCLECDKPSFSKNLCHYHANKRWKESRYGKS